uniref:Calcipressin-2 n=1 Tax=Strongyloides stercoralis TaxID=6248 RepID=A0A0K0E1E6_STRER
MSFPTAEYNIVTTDEDLPTAIIITEVPLEVFDDETEKQHFTNLFEEFQPDIHFDFLRSFQRLRIIFSSPEHATAALMLVKHHNYKGKQLKAFFARNIRLQAKTCQDSFGHLQLPTNDKLYLISPPASPPCFWEQTREMAPVICDIELMSRLAAISMEDDYSVHEGGIECPTIIVSPCKESNADEEVFGYSSKIPIPHTPMPPKCT